MKDQLKTLSKTGYRQVRKGYLASGDEVLSSKTRTRAFVKALLEFGPMSRLIDLGKPVPAYRKLLNRCLPGWVKNRGVYSSFAQASLHAPKGIPLGYDHSEISRSYEGFAEFVLASDYPAMLWLRNLVHEGMRVFDFGGNIGISFFAWENYVEYPKDLDWLVCDLPAVIQQGRELAAVRREHRLRFTTDFVDADGADLLLISGCLQYVEASAVDLLQQLRHLPDHLLINRTPLHPERSCVTLQNIGWMVSPYRTFCREEFIAGLESLGYELVDAWFDRDHSCWIPFYPEYSVEAYSGLYFRRIRESR